VQALIKNGTVVDTKAMLDDDATVWCDFALDESCAEAVQSAVASAPKLGPPALRAAILARAPSLVIKLLNLNVALDEGTRETFLADSAWRDFVVEESCEEAVDCVVAATPSLSSIALTAAISAQKPEIVARLLHSGMRLDEDAQGALLGDDSMQWRSFAVRSSCADAVVRVVKATPSLGSSALEAMVLAHIDMPSGDSMDHAIAIVTQLIELGVQVDQHARDSFLDNRAKGWRAFVKKVKCTPSIDPLIKNEPRLGPHALHVSLDEGLFEASLRLLNELKVSLDDWLFEELCAVSPKDKSTLWHQIVTVRDDPHVLIVIEKLAHANRGLLEKLDGESRTAYQHSIGEARKAMRRAAYFGGRYKVLDTVPVHQSRTCVVVLASDESDDKRLKASSMVVIKLMRHREQFEREVRAREQGLDSRFVVPILKSSNDKKLCARWEQDAEREGYPNYKYGIVLEHGKRNLMVALVQEHMNISQIRKMVRQFVQALGHMHAHNQIHADFKPLNGLRTNQGTWKLIDFDATVARGDFVGAKTSTSWNPPEMMTKIGGRIVVRARHETSHGSSQSNAGFDYELLKADPSFDWWSLGCLFYRALGGQPLFSSDDRDNLRDAREHDRLWSWNDQDLDAASREINFFMAATHQVDRLTRVAACDLLVWLLQPKPENRPSSSAEILSHAFFAREYIQDRIFSFTGRCTKFTRSLLTSHLFMTIAHHGGTCMSSLHVAAAVGAQNTTRSLLDRGMLPTSQRHLLHKTPVHLAAEGLRDNTLQLLLDHNAVLPRDQRGTESVSNIQDKSRNAPIHSMLHLNLDGLLTSQVRRWQVAFRMLFHLTDPTHTDHLGRTVLDIIKASSLENMKGLFEELRDIQRGKLFTHLSPVPWKLGASAGDQGGTSAEPTFEGWIRQKYLDQLFPELDDRSRKEFEVALDALYYVSGVEFLNSCVSFTPKQLPDHFVIVDSRGVMTRPPTMIVARWKRVRENLSKLLNKGEIAFFKAVLESCDRRTLITDFWYEKELGSGGFGTVCLAYNRHSATQRRAIKMVIPDGGAGSEKFTEALVETELQQRMSTSDFIAKIHIWGYAGKNMLWVLMDYAQFGSMRSFIKPNAGICWPDQDDCEFQPHLCNRWMEEIASALGHLRDMLVIHRDIKPENLLLFKSDNAIVAKLTDFGLAIKADDTKRDYGWAGTKNYMAPEILLCLAYSYEVDTWSYGITVFEMLTGKDPARDTDILALKSEADITLRIEDSTRKLDQHASTKRAAVFGIAGPKAANLLAFILRIRPSERPSPSEIVEYLYGSNYGMQQARRGSTGLDSMRRIKLVDSPNHVTRKMNVSGIEGNNVSNASSAQPPGKAERNGELLTQLEVKDLEIKTLATLNARQSSEFAKQHAQAEHRAQELTQALADKDAEIAALRAQVPVGALARNRALRPSEDGTPPESVTREPSSPVPDKAHTAHGFDYDDANTPKAPAARARKGRHHASHPSRVASVARYFPGKYGSPQPPPTGSPQHRHDRGAAEQAAAARWSTSLDVTAKAVIMSSPTPPHSAPSNTEGPKTKPVEFISWSAERPKIPRPITPVLHAKGHRR
jgi:serine/threonine protein kinase